MGWLKKILNVPLSESIEKFRRSLVSLKELQRVSLEKSFEYRRIQTDWSPYKEGIEKGQVSESVKSLNEKYLAAIKSIEENLQELSEKQDEVRKGIVSQIVKEPCLLPLVFMDDFIPVNKYNHLVNSLVKAHKEGRVSDSQLRLLTGFKKAELTDEEGVYVKDDRTQYADTIVIDDENKILFTVRNKNDDFCPGGYCLPGGHIEDGETPREAAKRELQEETGIEVDLKDFNFCGEYVDSKSHIFYYCVQSNVEPVVLEEREQQQWEKVPYDEIGEKPLILNLENNLRNIVAIPKSVMNPLADNAEKLYFDGKRFKKGEGSVPYLRGLKSGCMILKKGGECVVYDQDYAGDDELQKANRGHLVPKKIFITRSGRTFLTAVYVDPATGEIKEKPGAEKREIDEKLPRDVMEGDMVKVRTSRGEREGVVECLVKTKVGAYIGFRTPDGKYSEAYLKSLKDIDVFPIGETSGLFKEEEKKEIEPPIPIEELSEVDFGSLPRLGGSSETFLFENDGQRIFLKKEREGKAGQLKSETLADGAYRALGFRAPVSTFHDVKDEKSGESYSCKLSYYIEAQEFGSLRGEARKKAIERIQEGFAVDCLFANWDVIGANGDNILCNPDGDLVIRIDNGSSFDYRAKGSKKPDSSFLSSSTVVELDTMRSGSAASGPTKEVFGGLTDEQVCTQIEELSKKAVDLFSYLNDHNAPGPVIEALQKRLNYMKKWAKERRSLEEAEKKEKSKWDEPVKDSSMPSKVTEEYFADWDDFDLKGPFDLKDTLKKGIIEIEKERESGYEEAAKSMGLTLGQYKAKLQKLAEDFVSATFPGIVVHTRGAHEAFSKIFSKKDGRFKSLFEVKTGCGCTDRNARARYEKKVFGFPVDVEKDKELRTVYGCASNNERGTYGSIVSEGKRTASNYGDVFCEVKKSKAFQSATITLGDSLNSEDTYYPVPFGKPHFVMFSGMDYTGAKESIRQVEEYIEGSKKRMSSQGTYVEMQYHDQLSPSDIETIHCGLGKDSVTNASISGVVNNLLELAHGEEGIKCKVDIFVNE